VLRFTVIVGEPDGNNLLQIAGDYSSLLSKLYRRSFTLRPRLISVMTSTIEGMRGVKDGKIV
jgi:hypothetical protein